MINVLISGVGGQGSVLAAKILAQAATEKGWHVRTAETIGMAQRGGNVVSHVRMGNAGERIASSLVPQGRADCIIALEPGEGLRCMPFLSPDGLLITAQTPISSITSSVVGAPYDAAQTIAYLESAAPHFASVDDAAFCEAAGSRKVLNVGMLAAAIQASQTHQCGLKSALSLADLEAALKICVKPQFLDMNLAALNSVQG